MANDNENKSVGKNELFTDKAVVDDNLDIFDIEAARKSKSPAPPAPRAKAPQGRPAEAQRPDASRAFRPEARQASRLNDRRGQQPSGVRAERETASVRRTPVQNIPAQNVPAQKRAPAARPNVQTSSRPAAPQSQPNAANVRHVSKDDALFKQVYADSSYPSRPARISPQSAPAQKQAPAARQAEPQKAPVPSTRQTPAPASPAQKQAPASRPVPVPQVKREGPQPGEGAIKRAPSTKLPTAERKETAPAETAHAYRETAAERRAEKRENARIRKSAARLQLEEFDAENSYDDYEENEMPKNTRGKRALTTLAKTLIYIAVVALVSVLAATFIIKVANDVFAFDKEEKEIEVTIGEYATLNEIADQLSDKGVIDYPNIFVLYTKIKKRDTGKYVPGTYTVSTTQNYDELLSTFKEKTGSSGFTEISVTIPEGYTVDEIIDLLVSKGVGTREGFVDAIQNYEFDYWFVEELTDLNPNRKYRLEGYLYPDTYFIYKEWEEWRVINKMLTNFYNKFSIEYKNECAALGYSVDDIINIASIIQMEAKFTSDYDMVSSVIHNRLNNLSPETGRLLQCDATIQYFLPERQSVLEAAATRIDDPYNSYIYPGLPPGPISNPTIVAIRAALYPTSSNYCFFVSQKDGHMLYARTQAEHEKNVREALIEN